MSVSKASLLRKIDQPLEKEPVAGFTTDGKPLNKEAYNNRFQAAEKHLLSGEYLSQDDLEKESENW